MKVCFVSAFYPQSIATAGAMLKAWPLLRFLPPALAAQGHDVVVLAHAESPDERVIDGARYRFVDPGWLARSVSRAINRWKPRFGAAYYLPASHLIRALKSERPDVVHFSGLTLDIQLAQVARACSRLAIPLVVHYHGGVPDSGRIRHLQRYNAARISRVLVTAPSQATPWIAAGLFGADQFTQVVESSSPFSGIDRSLARTRTRMHGDPIYLSAGRLDAIKDPLTLLHGFERIVEAQPLARLYCYYLTAELLPDIASFLRERPALADRIELRGRVALDGMEAVMSSADFLLQASLREWSGLAVIEAMSCGCIPIVSDIPSLRWLTADGTAGRLFRVGDACALAHVAISISQEERIALSRVVRERFERDLSFPAIARRISAVYDELRPDCANPRLDAARCDLTCT